MWSGNHFKNSRIVVKCSKIGKLAKQIEVPEIKTMQSYDYANRQGIDEISWERFASLAAVLAERLIGIDAVVGIARAGLFPATAVACALRRELYPVRVT